MKTTGTIKKVLPVRTGMSKKGSTWAAQQFVLETEGDGAMLLEVFGQKEIDQYAIIEGEKLTVTYVPKVHEAGDKVFGKNSVTGIERDDTQPFAE
jgi:hypothetical protein